MGERACLEPSCGTDMAHKRRDAQYCSRECKCKSAKRRAAAEGRIRSNQDRYIRERERRLASARQYYWDKHEDNLRRAAAWRKNNPAKRRRWRESGVSYDSAMSLGKLPLWRSPLARRTSILWR